MVDEIQIRRGLGAKIEIRRVENGFILINLGYPGVEASMEVARTVPELAELVKNWAAQECSRG